MTRFIDRNGHKPSYQQIARHLGVKSRAGIQRHIEALEDQGLIERRRDNGRFAIDLPMQKIATDQVCGVEMIEVHGEDGRYMFSKRSIVTVPRYLIADIPPGDIFAVKIPDDSMIERQICEGDLVFFEKRSYARRGEIVAATSEGERVVLGLYTQRGRETEIRPADPDREPMIFPADEITLQGVMRGLLRPFPSNDHSD